MKSIPELKAEEARIRAILDGGAEAALRAIPGVVHVSVGLKQINGTATDEFSIRVYVAQKKDVAAIPPSERIPKRIGGVPTDVNQVQVLKPLLDTARYRPVTGGIQIGVVDATDNTIFSKGTLGCVATDHTDGNFVLVTCAHVIGVTVGNSVFQPDENPANLIGAVKRGLVSGTIDAAIADIDPAIDTTLDEINGLNLNGSNQIAGVAVPVAGMRVFKVGRTTGRTEGRVIDADAASDFPLGPPFGRKFFTKLVQIQSTKISGCCCCKCRVLNKKGKFADEGDSGSVVVSEQRIAIGMVMAKGLHEAFACRMTEVELGMNVTINSTGLPLSLEVSPDVEITPHGELIEPLAASDIPVDDEDTVWSIMQRRMEETPFGREVGAQVRLHLPEAIDLVNHHRAVMVAWQRAQGPSFLAQWMNGVRNPSVAVPKEINGVTMNSALLKLATVLKEYGSSSLHQAIDHYGLELMTVLDRSTTVDELMENISKPVLT